ncbi:hypothetical protein FRC12_003115 [Ceratobasidium sp. 428]|nr:hypothetical protein FRC12_003115 [Ceratobasidium sp. 428]
MSATGGGTLAPSLLRLGHTCSTRNRSILNVLIPLVYDHHRLLHDNALVPRMVAFLVLTAAFATANFAYLLFNPDSIVFEFSVFILGLTAPGIMTQVRPLMVGQLQLLKQTSSVVFNTEDIFNYYHKFNSFKLSLGSMSSNLVPRMAPGVASFNHWTHRSIRRPALAMTDVFNRDAKLFVEAYNRTLLLSYFSHPPISGFIRSPGILPYRSDVYLPGNRSVLNWSIPGCRLDGTQPSEREPFTLGLEPSLSRIGGGYVKVTRWLPRSCSGLPDPMTQCNLLDAPATKVDTNLTNDHSSSNRNRNRLFEEVPSLSYSGHPPARSPDSKMRRNDTCFSDSRPSVNQAVCSLRDSGLVSKEAPYVSAPELYLCPAQVANVDRIWAVLRMPNLCSRRNDYFNWRIGALVLFVGVFAYRFRLSASPEDTGLPAYTLPALPTHWMLNTELFNSKEEIKQPWIEYISALSTRTIYISDNETKRDTSEIELELLEDDVLYEVHPTPILNPADVPLPNDADDELLDDITTSSPSFHSIQPVPQSEDGEIKLFIDNEHYAQPFDDDLVSCCSDMSLASLCGGISDAYNECTDIVSFDIDISNFAFTFTFGIDGLPLSISRNCFFYEVYGEVNEERKNITSQHRKPRLENELSGMSDNREKRTKVTGTFRNRYSTLGACSDSCGDAGLGVKNFKSTNSTLDAGHNHFQFGFNFNTGSNRLNKSRTRRVYYWLGGLNNLSSNVEIPPAKRQKRFDSNTGSAESQDYPHKDAKSPADIPSPATSDNLEPPNPATPEIIEEKQTTHRRKKKSTRASVPQLSAPITTPLNPGNVNNTKCVRLYPKFFIHPSFRYYPRLRKIREEKVHGETDEKVPKSRSKRSKDLTIVASEPNLQEGTTIKPSISNQPGSCQKTILWDYETRGSYLDFDSDEDKNEEPLPSKFKDSGHRTIRSGDCSKDTKIRKDDVVPRIPPPRPSRVGVPPLGVYASYGLSQFALDASQPPGITSDKNGELAVSVPSPSRSTPTVGDRSLRPDQEETNGVDLVCSHTRV